MSKLLRKCWSLLGKNWESITAISAIVISLASLWFGVQAQSKQQEFNQESLNKLQEYNQLSFTPKLEIHINSNAMIPPLGLSLINVGLGPAIIDSIFFFHSNREPVDFLASGEKSLMARIIPKDLLFTITRPSFGSWILPKDSLRLLILNERHTSDSDISKYVDFIDSIQVGVLSHSVYNVPSKMLWDN